MAWHDTIDDLTLTVDGSVVADSSGGANRTLLSASWTAGRSDWFASLAPSTASFTLLGDLATDSTIVLGDELALSMGSDTLWTGTVDTVVVDEAAGQPTTTTVTATDTVGTLGEAKVHGETLDPGSLDDQLVDVLGFADLTVSVVTAPTANMPTLELIDPFDSSVLDWITHAEEEGNAFVSSRPNGDLIVTLRRPFQDYGERAASGLALPISVPAASSFWRMDEASGTIVDGLGVANGTAAGTPVYGNVGPWGASGPDAVGFQEADAADEFTFGDVYDLTGTSWTIAGWAYWFSGGTGALLSKAAAGPDGWAVEITSTDALRFRAYNAGTELLNLNTATSSVPGNTWFHWAVVKNGTTVTLYLDGISQGSGTIGGTIPNTAAVLRMGSFQGISNWLGGRMCMVGIWNGSGLGAAQLVALIDLGAVELTGDLAPQTWSPSRDRGNIINRWEFDQFGSVTVSSNATSISAYGQRTRSLSSDAFTALEDVYDSALRGVVANPRPVVTARIEVLGAESGDLILLEPIIGLAIRSGVLWQVLQVQHDVDPETWSVTLTLDMTQNDLSGSAPLLPV